jgi:AmpE protein
MFLALIIALLTLKTLGNVERFHHDNWFHALQGRLSSWPLPEMAQVLLTVLLPVLVAHFLLQSLAPLLFGLLWLVLAVMLLIYDFGREDYGSLYRRYTGYLHNGDSEGAWHHASEELFDELDDSTIDDAAKLHHQLQRELLYQGYQGLFAVLFYFVLLGPVGALAYRLLQLYGQRTGNAAASCLQFYADWLPARVLVVVFSFLGDFLRSRDQMLTALLEWDMEPRAMLLGVANAASGYEADSVEQDLSGPVVAAAITDNAALLSRSTVAWVVLVALYVVFL